MEVGDHPGGAQGIRHQGAAAGAKLDQQDRVGRALIAPDLGAPQADQFAEHLADFGRGDEVAARAERIAVHVVAMARVGQGFGHEVGDGDRPKAGDARAPGARPAGFVAPSSALGCVGPRQ